MTLVLLTPAAARTAKASGGLRLGQAPYAGVRCPQPNSIACDRIGLAVWLVRPAVGLTATVSGKPIRMMIPARARYQHGYYCAGGCYFEGALHPAGLLEPGPLHIQPDAGAYYWAGRNIRSLRVRLTARYRGGSIARTSIRIWLHAGWG